MQNMKRIYALVFSAMLLYVICIAVYAQKTPDLSVSCSVHITMRYGENAVSDSSLTLYRIGEVWEANGNFSFEPEVDFAGCVVSSEDIEASETAKALADYAEERSLSGTEQRADSDGKISFEDLAPGLYLLMQKDPPAGYERVQPFLVSLPMEQDGVYVYDVDASPKVSLETLTPSRPPQPPQSNEPTDPTLPQTGQLNWPIPILTVSGLILLSFGWVMCLGKRKNCEN